VTKVLLVAVSVATSLFICSGGFAYATSRVRNSISSQNQENAASHRFAALMQKLVENPPDDCTGPGPINKEKTDAGLDTEHKIFGLLGDVVLEALGNTLGKPTQAAQAALIPFQNLSARLAASWSADERLRYELLAVQPLLIVKLAIWNQDAFIAYAPTSPSGSQPPQWKIAMLGDTDDAPFEKLEMFALWRGPSKNPRFLIVKHFRNCMAGMTHDYEVHGCEWKSEQREIVEILDKTSEFSEGDRPGKLHTSGSTITIPYCWSGALHFTSVSAPICSLDTYDLSGDSVRLIGTQNDPEDLTLIEKVIESVKAQDVAALTRYCESSEIAQRVMKTMPLPPDSFFIFNGYSSKQLGPGKEQLDLSDDKTMRFVLEKRGSSWLVADFELAN
jgi:hypothetical protein